MDLLFLICAVFGGTFLVTQFLLGLGGGHQAADDDGFDTGFDDQAGDLAGDTSDAAHGDHQPGHHSSTWVFGVLSLRTVLIGLTFFGLTGKAASASQFESPWPLLIAVSCGLGSMYGVYFLMRGLYRLTADGTQRIGRAIGEEGSVYLTIPGGNSGVGKVHVPVQNRIVEFEAMTAGDKLPTGSRVIVVGVVGSDRVEVEPLTETARNPRA